MSKQSWLRHILTRFNPLQREQGAVLKKFYDTLGFVHFGKVHQHDDEYDAIRGFSSSLTHRDDHFAVGAYNGHDIRMTNRTDTTVSSKNPARLQILTIIEVHLHVRNMPHFFFLPTGTKGDEYERLFTTQSFMQPIDSVGMGAQYSPEFHGRYQILSRITKAPDVERLLTSPTIVGIGARFWPHGIEIEHGRLYVYIPDEKLTQKKLERALDSALWLADRLVDTHEKIQAQQEQ